jgi:hypothetical protein
MIALATNAPINVLVVNLLPAVKNVLHPLFACLLLLAFAKMATLMMETPLVVNAIILASLVTAHQLRAHHVTPLYKENLFKGHVLVRKDGTIQVKILCA